MSANKKACACALVSHLREQWLTQAGIVLGSCGQLSCAGGHWSSSRFAVVLFH